MKKSIKLLVVTALIAVIGCKKTDEIVAPSNDTTITQAPGQEEVKDDTSNPNIVQVAIGSKDHTTLVAAVKAAELGYHTYVGTLKTEYMQDGQEFDMVFGGKVKITKKDDKTFVNGSEIVASIPTSNGIIHVIGDVLLPK